MTWKDEIKKFRVPNKNSKIVREGETTGSIKESMLNILPPNYNVKKFAKLVGEILDEEYGEHNFDSFMEVLHEEIAYGDSNQLLSEYRKNKDGPKYKDGPRGKSD